MRHGKLRTLKTNLKSFCELHKGTSERMIQLCNIDKPKKKFYLCKDCFNETEFYRYNNFYYREL